MTDKLIEAMEREWQKCLSSDRPDYILCNTEFLRKMLRTVIRRRGKVFVIYPGLVSSHTVSVPSLSTMSGVDRSPSPYWRNAGQDER